MDWSNCEFVEIIPGKVGGVPLLKNSRVQADAIIENSESGSSIEEISENFTVPIEQIHGVLSYAAAQLQPRG